MGTSTRTETHGGDAGKCRHLAELLDLDAVGIVRRREGRRAFAWWVSPESDIERADLNRILDDGAAGWITCPRGDDVVFAHVTPGSQVRSVSALSAMLVSLASTEGSAPAPTVGGVAPEDAIERERTRLAYAIHDGLTQVVTASVLEIEWLARQASMTPERASEALAEAAGELRRALDEIRGVLSGLGPHGADAQQPIDDLLRGVVERWQLPATWSIEGDLHAVPGRVLEAASSVIRESVANAAKHSSSDEVAVSVSASRSGVEVRVEDTGTGFDPEETGLDAGHLGLEMMRRRVAEVNGTLDIESGPGHGTRVVAKLPVETNAKG